MKKKKRKAARGAGTREYLYAGNEGIALTSERVCLHHLLRSRAINKNLLP